MSRFVVKNKEEAIKDLIGGNQVVTVTGAYFGDEAKGKTVDGLSEHVDAIARSNSGANAGHTVYIEGKKFVFHLVPSGISTGKPTFIGSNCVVDPVSLVEEEIKPLSNAGIDYNNLVIGNSFVVAPWHKVVDLSGNPNASTGKGMSQVHQDIRGKRAASIEDFINGDYRQLKKSFDFWMRDLYKDESELDKIRELLSLNPKVPQHVKEYLELSTRDDALEFTINSFSSTINDSSFPKIGNPRRELNEILKKGGKILIEGPQSAFLANQEGTHYSSSTSADTTPSGIVAAMGISHEYSIKNINVTKMPSSRVGSGANPSGYVEQDWFADRDLKREDLEAINLDFDHVYSSFIDLVDDWGHVDSSVVYENKNGENVEVEGEYITINEALAIASCLKFEEYGATTGKPRVCGALDIPHLAHLVRYQNKEVSFSCLDRLDGLEKIAVVTSYVYENHRGRSNGEVYTRDKNIISHQDELPGENILKRCKPVYQVLEGWKNSKITEDGKPIDPALSDFFNYVEARTGAKVISFGNGPKTEDIVYVSKERL